MKIGVLLLNFGEPDEATPEVVIPFLERIFALNAPLMGPGRPESEVRSRSRAMAEARAPGLIAEYEEIGGSPLHRQASEQAEALEAELRRRGHDAVVLLGMQFTDPPIEEAIARARTSGIERLVSIPVYPLCGPTTNVAALQEVDRQVQKQNWLVESRQVSGWHRHPAYLALRIATIQRLMDEHGLTLSDPGTKLVFSAHGTPLKYLEEGSRYEEYVLEFCAAVARGLGAPDYLLGYQNHTNRPEVRWTQPDIEKVIEEVAAERVIVDAVSFMHEQSETLAELDGDLREEAEGRGLEFYRVPIPYLDESFIAMLADFVEMVTDGEDTGDSRGGKANLYQCRCKPSKGTFCTNGKD